MAPPPLHPLPTREEFLATGLERVSGQTMEICTVCLAISGSDAELGSPVFLKCLFGNHTFCRKCITTWLNTSNENTCPACRRELFVRTGRPDPPDFDPGFIPGFIDPGEESADEDADPRAVRQRRRARVDYAFTASGLASIRWRDAYVPPAPLSIVFHNDIQWNQGSLRASASAAHNWLVWDCGLLDDGGHTIYAPALGASLHVMGNLLMTLNVIEQTAWSDADLDTWREIVVDIWRFLLQYKGARMYRSSLYLSLMASLLDKHYFGAAHQSPFFQEDSQLCDDLKILVNFVMSKSGPFIEWNYPDPRPRTVRKKRQKVPRQCPLTATEPAVVQATAWMDVLFGL